MNKAVDSIDRFFNKYYALLLGLIIFLGTGLRLFNITAKSLCYDEFCSVCFVQKDWSTILFHRYQMRPVYFLVLKIWTEFFGYKELAIRSLSVVFGIIAIYMLAKIGKSLFDAKTGILSALLLSLSTYHILRCQLARGYSFLMLLFLFSVYFFWQIQTRKIKWSYVLFAITIIMIFYTNFLAGGISFLLYNLFYAGGRFTAKKSWVITQIIILFFAAPLIFPIMQYYSLENYTDKFCPIEYRNIFPNIIADFSYGMRINHGGVGCWEVLTRPLLTKGLLYVFALVLTGSGIVWYRGLKGKYYLKKRVVFLLFWLILPVVVLVSLNFHVPISRWSKALIICLPALYLLIALGIKKFNMLVQSIVIIMIIIFSVISLQYYYSAQCESWREIAEVIKNNAKQDEIIVVAPLQNLAPFWYYYKYNVKKQLYLIEDGDLGRGIFKEGVWDYKFHDKQNLIIGVDRDKLDEFLNVMRTLKNNHTPVWLIISQGWMYDGRKVIKYFDDNFLLKYKIEYPWEDVEIRYYY